MPRGKSRKVPQDSPDNDPILLSRIAREHYPEGVDPSTLRLRLYPPFRSPPVTCPRCQYQGPQARLDNHKASPRSHQCPRCRQVWFPVAEEERKKGTTMPEFKSVQWVPNGRRFAVTSDTDAIRVYDANNELAFIACFVDFMGRPSLVQAVKEALERELNAQVS